MGTVTGYTAERMKAIEDASVVNGEIDPATGHLILTRFDESTIDAGLVVTSPKVVTSSTRPTGGALFDGLLIYETDTKMYYSWNGTTWIPRGIGFYHCTSATRPATPFDGLAIYETDTKLFLYYNGTGWRALGPNPAPLSGIFPNTAFADGATVLTLNVTAPYGANIPYRMRMTTHIRALITASAAWDLDITSPSGTALCAVRGGAFSGTATEAHHDITMPIEVPGGGNTTIRWVVSRPAGSGTWQPVPDGRYALYRVEFEPIK